MSAQLARLVINLLLTLVEDYVKRHLPPTGQSNIEALLHHTKATAKEEGLL